MKSKFFNTTHYFNGFRDVENGIAIGVMHTDWHKYRVAESPVTL